MSSLMDSLAGTVPLDVKQPTVELPHSGNVRMVPYDARLDPQAPEFLPYLWRRLQKDDLVDYYWPGQRDTGYATFVRMMSGDANVALAITDDESKQWDRTVAGFITWSPMALGASETIIAGFIFFKEFWDHKTTDNAGAAAFRYWFTQTKAETVLGVCPSLHLVALRYNRRIGLREMGRIPKGHLFKGEVCDAVLVGITREEWEGRH